MSVIRKPKSVEEFIQAGGIDPTVDTRVDSRVDTLTDARSDSDARKDFHSPTNSKNDHQGDFQRRKAKGRVGGLEDVQPVKLRLPQILLQQIDDSVGKRKPCPSRHQWILEAIYEKLAKSHRHKKSQICLLISANDT